MIAILSIDMIYDHAFKTSIFAEQLIYFADFVSTLSGKFKNKLFLPKIIIVLSFLQLPFGSTDAIIS